MNTMHQPVATGRLNVGMDAAGSWYLDDIMIARHASVVLVHPLSPAGVTWIVDHVYHETQRWCNAIVVEPRAVDALVEGMVADGLSVGEQRTETWHALHAGRVNG